jgi:hypothetical protein
MAGSDTCRATSGKDRVKVLSPAMVNIVEVDVLADAKNSMKGDARVSRYLLYRGLSLWPVLRWQFGKYAVFFRMSYAKTSQQRRGLANDAEAVGLTASTMSGEKLLLWGSGQQWSIKLSADFTNTPQEWLKKIGNQLALQDWWPMLKAKLTEHYNHFGISGNYRCLLRFYKSICSLTVKWINRRSQKKSMTFEWYVNYLQLNPLTISRICYALYTF